jgi:hypothetical protein
MRHPMPQVAVAQQHQQRESSEPFAQRRPELQMLIFERCETYEYHEFLFSRATYHQAFESMRVGRLTVKTTCSGLSHHPEQTRKTMEINVKPAVRVKPLWISKAGSSPHEEELPAYISLLLTYLPSCRTLGGDFASTCSCRYLLEISELDMFQNVKSLDFCRPSKHKDELRPQNVSRIHSGHSMANYCFATCISLLHGDTSGRPRYTLFG